MTFGHMSTDKVTNETWLLALRSEPSPLFKARLRERLHAQEPARRHADAIGRGVRCSSSQR